MRRVCVIVIMLLALSACGRGGDGPAPVIYGGGDYGDGRGRDAAGAPRSGPGIHTVRRGETLSEIAARYRVDLAAMAAANDLAPPYILRIGQRLRIPRPRQYRVARGDTVYGIARRYRVPIRAIIEANDLSPPYELRVDQVLRIPAPRTHQVARGDTLYSISRRYDVNLSDLARLNGLSPPYTITPGQRLLMPSQETQVASAASGATTDAAPDRSATATQTAQRSPAPKASNSPSANTESANAASSNRAPVTVPKPRPKPEAVKQAAASRSRDSARTAQRRPREVPEPPARASSRFAWPLRGEIVTDFGPQDGGLHNDGINIAARRGTPVRAAENGVVAYVGNELRGFGNLVLIKHAEGWITAYAHLDEILVARGDKVGRGDRIARVGSSGGVTEPQLHFETRRGSDAVNPRKVLGTMQAKLAE